MSLQGLLLVLPVCAEFQIQNVVSAAMLCLRPGPLGLVLNASWGSEELSFPAFSLVGWLLLLCPKVPRRPHPGSPTSPWLPTPFISQLLSFFSRCYLPSGSQPHFNPSSLQAIRCINCTFRSPPLQRAQQEGCSCQQEMGLQSWFGKLGWVLAALGWARLAQAVTCLGVHHHQLNHCWLSQILCEKSKRLLKTLLHSTNKAEVLPGKSGI